MKNFSSAFIAVVIVTLAIILPQSSLAMNIEKRNSFVPPNDSVMIKICPNQVTDNLLNIKTNIANAENAFVQIYDNKGKEILRCRLGNGHISLYNPIHPVYGGMYYVRITDNSGITYPGIKFIKF